MSKSSIARSWPSHILPSQGECSTLRLYEKLLPVFSARATVVLSLVPDQFKNRLERYAFERTVPVSFKVHPNMASSKT